MSRFEQTTCWNGIEISNESALTIRFGHFQNHKIDDTLFRLKVPKNQQDFETIISGLVGYHWLGISDKDSEGVQKNIYTGEAAYVQWRGGEPNGGSGEVINYS